MELGVCSRVCSGHNPFVDAKAHHPCSQPPSVDCTPPVPPRGICVCWRSLAQGPVVAESSQDARDGAEPGKMTKHTENLNLDHLGNGHAQQ